MTLGDMQPPALRCLVVTVVAVLLSVSGCVSSLPAAPPASPVAPPASPVAPPPSPSIETPLPVERPVDARQRAEAASRARLAGLAGQQPDVWVAGAQGQLRADLIAVHAVARDLHVRVEVTQVTSRPAPTDLVVVQCRGTARVEGVDAVGRTLGYEDTWDGNGRLVASRVLDRPQPWDLAVEPATRLSADPATREPADPAARLPADPAARESAGQSLGSVVVRRTPGVVVVGAPGPALSRLVTAAERARAEVEQVWPSERSALIVLPASLADAAAVLGLTVPALSGRAAIVDGPWPTSGTQPMPAGADRVVVVPSTLPAVSERGLQVVLAHELTHVAVRATTAHPVPPWLSEGFAELVAYRATGLGPAAVTPAVATAVRRRDPITTLPTGAQLDAAATRLRAYGEAWLAVRAIEQAHGLAAVTALYRAAAAAPSEPPSRDQDTAVPNAGATPKVGGIGLDRVTLAALRATTGWDEAALKRAWRAQLEALRAPP